MAKNSSQAWVLLYHEMDSKEHPCREEDAAYLNLVVKRDEFCNQLDLLVDRGWPVITLDSFLSDSNESQADDSVVITFDDGHRSNYTVAFQPLVERDMTAMFYLIGEKVDSDPDYLTGNQMREMTEHGMEFGSHTQTHPFLPLLDDEQIRTELLDSKRRLEDLVGTAVRDLALPGGHGSKRVFSIAEEVGYRSVATCKIGSFAKGSDPMRIPRLEIRRSLPLEGFSQSFDGSKVFQLQAVEFGKSCFRKSLGLNNYARLRKLVSRFVSIRR